MTDEFQASSPSAVPVKPKLKPGASVRKFFLTARGKIIALTACVAVLMLVGVQQVYSRPMTDTFVRAAASIIPFPAISVDGTTVTLKDFLTEYVALEQYFKEEKKDGPNGDDLEVAIADTIVNKLAIRQLAQRRGIAVDAVRVEKYYQDVIASEESEEMFMRDLKDSFGWSREEFKSRVVEAIVLALQMSEEVLGNQDDQRGRREIIDTAYARLKNGEDFAVVAKDVHAGFGGTLQSDLGYVKQSVIPATWVFAVENLPVGSYTDVLDLPEGFAVFKLEERIVAGEDTQLRLLVVSAPKKTLEEVVKEHLEDAEVKRYVGEE